MRAPSQPPMRSLLSQFQTPAAPHRAVGFFGSGCPAGYLTRLIAQPTSDWRLIRKPTLSAGANDYDPTSIGKNQCRFLVHSQDGKKSGWLPR
jgi:hypothetical protein